MDLSVLGLTKEIKFRLQAFVLAENEIKLEQYGFSNNINVESVILFVVEFIGFFIMISLEVSDYFERICDESRIVKFACN